MDAAGVAIQQNGLDILLNCLAQQVFASPQARIPCANQTITGKNFYNRHMPMGAIVDRIRNWARQWHFEDISLNTVNLQHPLAYSCEESIRTPRDRKSTRLNSS